MSRWFLAIAFVISGGMVAEAFAANAPDYSKSAKGADARRQSQKELANPSGGAPSAQPVGGVVRDSIVTVSVLREFLKEAAVIQSITIKVSFNAQGAPHWQQALSVKIQSEAAVRQYGVLSFAYASTNQQVTFDYVRVRKPDGSLVETPQSSIVDLATDVAASAPTYNDIRQKQIPVKALGVGDVLEYSVQISEDTPETPGQFWYSQPLIDQMVVLNQTVEISVPATRYVQVSSPGLKPEIRDEGGQRTYLWKHSHLDPSKPADEKNLADEHEPPKIELTTFTSWDEVGSWFSSLAAPQAAVTPAIQTKAKELTAGFSSDSEKARAIYKYVATKFRYISISLGIGRYRPHTAEEVLANQYGDCKDKHTLLAALLKAEGINAWPALIGAGLKFNADVPSPAAFNHVITVIPESGKYVWLDTTAEVAPYGLINQAIRDEEALVIPNSAKAFLQKTPADPPFSTTNSITSTGSLTADGKLTSHFDWHVEGDIALGLRGAFRQLAPAQWQIAVQQMSYALGFAGDVSAVEVEDLENIDKPFRYTYDYNRKDYSDWAEHKITFPVPPLSFGPGPDADKPKEPFWAGEPGAFIYRATIHLPNGFTLDVPPDVSLTTGFADYSAHYSLKDGTFACERNMIIKRSKVALDEWAAYQKFMKGVQTDQTTFISLSETSADADASRPAIQQHVPVDNNPEAEKLINLAMQAMQAQNVPEARDLLGQAEKLNPAQPRLWVLKSYVASSSGRTEEGLADARKEVELHPDEIAGYGQLATMLTAMGKTGEAIDVWRKTLELSPGNEKIAGALVTLLLQTKRYAEIAPALKKSIAEAPGNYRLRALRVRGLLRAGDNDRGIAEAQEIAKATGDPQILNDLAYEVTDSGVIVPSAVEWIQRSIAQTEQDCAKVSLAALEQKDLTSVNLLAAEWDTLGWIYFKQSDVAKAEKYVDASWRLSQNADIADHLGQIYQREGKQTQAIHMWRLALAAQGKNENAKELLRQAGVPVTEPIARGTPLRLQPVPAAEELGQLRTIKLPALPKDTPSADYFVVLSRQGVQEVEIASESEAPGGVKEALRTASFNFTFPDDGTEKIVRRGILSCSAYTHPNCQFTMYPLSSTNTAGLRKPEAGANPSSPVSMSDPQVVAPALISKVDPEYSDTARRAGLEGAVLLKVVIDEQGFAQDITIVKSLGMGLDENAKACVTKWRFKPGTMNGKPVKVAAQVEVNFKLLHPAQ